MAEFESKAFSSTETDPKTVLNRQAESDQAKLIPIFKIWGQGSVHEDITKEAAKLAKVPYTKALEKGVEWPDVPSKEAGETNYWGLTPLFGSMHKKGTITHDSHYGKNQFWHSMTPSDKSYTNGEVLDKIVAQAKDWYALAQKEKNIFHVGKILHMVQDSYSESHTIRQNGKIVTFQRYDQQDAAKHGNADKIPKFGGTWRDIPGASDALQASIKILELYKANAPPKALEDYLRNKVFPFNNALTKNEPAGAIDPKYDKTRAQLDLPNTSNQLANNPLWNHLTQGENKMSAKDAVRVIEHMATKLAVQQQETAPIIPQTEIS